MRKFILLAVFALIALPFYGEVTTEKKPCPDWVFEKPSPSEENKRTFDYYVGVGYGGTMEEATNKAKADALKKAVARIGVQVSSSDLYEAEHNGDYLKILTSQFEIPVVYLYEYCEQAGEMYKMHVLCQAGINANITPKFENYKETFNIIKSIKEKDKAAQAAILKKVNGKAIAASAFIPGLGQMLKGKGGAGAGILISEVALIGGGTACYFLGQKQDDIMKGRDTSYEAYMNAKSTKKSMDIAMYSCYGAAAAIYIFNLCHAYMCKPTEKGIHRLSFYPVIIPANELTTPNYAYGVGIQYKF